MHFWLFVNLLRVRKLVFPPKKKRGEEKKENNLYLAPDGCIQLILEPII